MIRVSNDTLPENAAKRSRQKPSGQAAIFLWNMANDLFNYSQDKYPATEGRSKKYPSPWPTYGIKKIRYRAEWFFSRFRNAGGRMDLLVLDFEQGFPMWGMEPEHLRAIWNDPRCQALTPKYNLNNIEKVIHWQGSKEYVKWNRMMGELVCETLNAALFDPAHKLYPKAKASNFNSVLVNKKNIVPELNGHRQNSLAYFGTHGSRSFYGQIGALASVRLDNKNEYGRSPFSVLRWHLNTMRAIKRSSDVPFFPWVSHKRYRKSVFRDTQYYEELIYHLALSGVDGFLYWNPRPWRSDQDPDYYANEEQDRLLNDCLATINQYFKTQKRKCVTIESLAWDSPLLATGMQIGTTKILWRVTAPPSTRAIRVMPSGLKLELNGNTGIWYVGQLDKETTFEIVEPINNQLK